MSDLLIILFMLMSNTIILINEKISYGIKFYILTVIMNIGCFGILVINYR